MKTLKSNTNARLRGFLSILLIAAAPLAGAATVWNGPAISFSHTPQNGLKDQLTPGVAITRGGSGGLYNAITEGGATANISPKDTEWAVGALADFMQLGYGPCPLEAGNRPPNLVGTTYVVHLIAEDIYLSLTLTGWGGAGGGGNTTFSYTRSTPASITPPTPTVAITNPASGSVFAAPAKMSLGAKATVSGGTVTNVQFFANGASLGSVPTTPFSVTTSNLAPGAYAITAVATAAGISATSAVVNVSVVSPATVNLSVAGINNGQFSWNYTADAGLAYVIQSSSNLVDRVSVTTNLASGSLALFSDPFVSTGRKFYRVGRLPNP